jgi:hypothetical protein
LLRLLTSPNKLGLIIILLFLMGLALLLCPERAPAANDPAARVPLFQEADTEPGKDTDFAATAPVNTIDVRLVGQLSRGMRQIKEQLDGGLWGFCGEELTEAEQVEMSIEIAYGIVSNMQSIGIDVSPWGVLGTMYNESKFDACALGIGPRSWAYREGLLQPRKRFVSHTWSEVLQVVQSQRARQRFALTGFDLGLCQVLTRFYPHQEKEMLTLTGGVRICVLEMQTRAQRHRTRTPWLYWRGSETGWYRSKVRRWARLMGAPMNGEI